MNLTACCYCGASLRPLGPDAFALTLDEPGGGPKIRMVWCRACAEIDPAHLALAEALALPDGVEETAAISRAYAAILARVMAERGAEGARRAIDVRRDAEGAVTFRGPGIAWGRPATR